mgnify:CR=1 FL=1
MQHFLWQKIFNNVQSQKLSNFRKSQFHALSIEGYEKFNDEH